MDADVEATTLTSRKSNSTYIRQIFPDMKRQIQEIQVVASSSLFYRAYVCVCVYLPEIVSASITALFCTNG